MVDTLSTGFGTIDAETETRTAYHTCPLCEAGCGLEITIRDGAVGRIRGDRDDVFSRGFICPKGSTLKQLHDDPDRLRRPLVKRDGVHVEVDWPEAWREVLASTHLPWATPVSATGSEGPSAWVQRVRFSDAAIAMLEWMASEPPRRITPLPAFRHNAAASAVTLGRAS